MKKENTKNLPQDKDRHLDVPAEANRDGHHNYLADDKEDQDNRKLTERQKQWKEGLEEGRQGRQNE